MKIVVNGWDLAVNPTGVAGLFALEWLNGLADSNPEVDLQLVVPKFGVDLQVGDRIEMHELNLGTSAWDRIRFEQGQLLEFGLDTGAKLVVYPTGGAPLLSRLPVVTFPPLSKPSVEWTVIGRLAWALGNAGISGASTRFGVLEPSEHPRRSPGYVELPAWVSEGFNPLIQTSDQECLSNHSLQPGYVLSFVSGRSCLVRVLEVWRWVIESTDAGHPLLIAGLPKDDREFAKNLIQRLEMGEAVKVVNAIKLHELPAVYRQAACYFHACRTPYGQELRWAMAAGVPVAGIETPVASRILQEAGYLALPNDERGLAAACITILVESTMADQLRQKGLTIARHYHQASFLETLMVALMQAAQV